MTPIGIILKLIEFLGLTSSEELRILTTDAKEWEKSCAPDSEDKGKQFYYKISSSIWTRLAGPFLYFVGLKEAKKIMTMDSETEFLD